MTLVLDKIRTYRDNMKSSSPELFDGVLVCKLSGVTYDNRQEYLSRVDSGTHLRLERDRRNEFDFHAVKVMALLGPSWQDIGFIPSSVNKTIAEALDSGVKLRAKVWKCTGGQGEFYRGLSITISRME